MNIQKNNITTFKQTIKVIVRPHYKRLYDTLFSSKRFKYIYLKIATFLATHGFSPLLAPSATSTKERWQRQGTDDLLPTPKTYIKEDNSIYELFRDVLPYLDKDSPILEIGCNVGRSLNYLNTQGYRNLTGIEIGPKAVELMKATFPDMYNNSKILIGDAPNVIKGLNTDEFDLVFCHSVLVNIHPKYNYIFEEMARVSKKFILILENEGSYTAYPRDFKKMFEKQRYKMIVSKVFSGACSSLAVPFEEKHIYENNTIRLFVKVKSSF
jgi:SAM-dependent methyltransferase